MLTDEGRRLLDTAAGALQVVNHQITRFLEAHEGSVGE
jgi:hypothetical protein